MTKKKTNTTPPPPPPVPDLSLAGTDANTGEFSVDKVWSKKLGKKFTPISHYFIQNYHRLKYPINPNEFTLIVHLFSYKWDEAMPYPAVSSLATQMGKSKQAIRTMLRSLEEKEYIKRNMRHGHRSHYDLRPLINAVEKLYDEDIAAKRAKAEAELKALKSA